MEKARKVAWVESKSNENLVKSEYWNLQVLETVGNNAQDRNCE